MSVWKLAIVAVVVAVVGVFAYDGVQVLNAHRNIADTASASASAAAHAIATNKGCATAPVVAKAKTCASARAAADQAARVRGDVVTSFDYNAVAAKVYVTVSGTASSLVLHYFDNNLTDNIHASSSARPG